MKIIFIRHYSIVDEIIPPLHFGFLASTLSNTHKVIIYDQLRDKFSNDHLIKLLLKENPEVIGCSAYTRDISQIKAFMSKVRPLLPNAKIVLGGMQMSIMPQETFEYFDGLIDYGFAGESEWAFSTFIDFVNGNELMDNLNKIPNLVWKSGEDIKINLSEYPENLDEIPFPRWELIPPDSYPKAPHGAFLKQYPVAPIITSRGCPYSCTFCAAGTISGKKVRYRSIDNIIEEIKYLNKDFNVKEIHIEDDNFSMRKGRAIEFSERILREGLGITWAFPNGLRLDNLDLPTLKLMHKAGCYSLNVGVESGNDEILRKIKKRITREEIKAKISMVKDAGLDIGGFFIIGFPGETVKEIKDTINFARELPLDRIGISYFQTYPGTEEYKKLCDSGEYKLDLAISEHSLHTVSYVPKNITEKQLRRLRLKGFIKFYLRPKIILKLLKEVRSLEHFSFILKRGKRWLNN